MYSRSRLLVPVVLVVCCALIMTPRLVAPSFGLLDDGTTLLIADAYEHNPLGVANIEAARGRFRPIYWLYYIEQYPLWGKSPVGYFAVQFLALAITTVLLSRLVLAFTDSYSAALLAGLAFLISGPVIEAYYTLSKPEPPMVMFIAAASVCLFEAMCGRSRRKLFFLTLASVFTFLAYLTKETAIILLPISIGLCVLKWRAAEVRKTLVAYCGVNVICTVVFLAGRLLTGTSGISEGTDSTNYVLNSTQLAASATQALAWFVRDFAFVIPLVLGAVVVARHSMAAHSGARLLMQYGTLLSAGWILVMLPWRSSFEYYLLPVAFGAAVVLGGAWALLRQQPRQRMVITITAAASLMMASVPLINELTTAQIQLTLDANNAGLVQAVARTSPPNGVVLASLPENSEYVFELGLQLRELYGRGDVVVSGADAVPVPTAPGTLVAVQRVENRPAVMPRIATGSAQPETLKNLSLSSIWSTARQLQIDMVNAQEPVCRLVRGLGAPTGDICQNPVLVLDRHEFVYGWDLYRVA